MTETAGTYLRAYPVQTFANAAKVDVLRELLPLWQRGCQHLVGMSVVRLQHGERLPKFIDTHGLPSYLSARQWKSVWNQTRAALSAWLGSLTRIVRSYLQHSTLDGEFAIDLFKVNKGRMWWVARHEAFSPEVLALSRALVKQAMRRCPPPRMDRVTTMVMDATVAEPEAARTKTFDGWLRISTAKKRSCVRIPFREHDHGGEPASVVQVSLPADGSLVVRRAYRHPQAPTRDEGRELGLDWGMRSLFATSDGRLVGLHLYDWLKDRDNELAALTRELGRQRVRYRDSTRYRNLNSRIRDHVVNEVNRVLNRLVTDDMAALVVESLDFRHGGLSKRMNRLVTRAGRGAVTRKLASLTEERGITVHKVNPAYTSKECSGCGHIHDSNRSGTKFRCRFCGRSLHADINGARNIVGRRSSYTGGLVMMSVRQVRVIRDLAFKERWAASSLDNHARAAGLGSSREPELITRD